jgi:hypothetical protein
MGALERNFFQSEFVYERQAILSLLQSWQAHDSVCTSFSNSSCHTFLSQFITCVEASLHVMTMSIIHE